MAVNNPQFQINVRKNLNLRSTAFGKYFAKAVYDKGFIGTKQLAEFIQTQASVKRSDIVAVLDELGSAMPTHLLAGMMAKAKDVVNFLFQKLGVNGQQIDMPSGKATAPIAKAMTRNKL